MADLSYLWPPPPLLGLGLNLAQQNEGKGLAGVFLELHGSL